MDHRKSINIVVSIDYIDLINSCYNSNSLKWVDHKDRVAVFGVGHYDLSDDQEKRIFLNNIEMTESEIS